MNLTAQGFLDRITAAFEYGDLNDPDILGDALAGLNFIDSAGGNDFIKDCLYSLDVGMILRLPMKPARHSSGLCKIPVSKHYTPLFWVEDKKTFFNDRHINRKYKGWAIKYINERLRLDSMAPSAFRRKIIWLSDLGGVMPASGSNAWQLFYDLGSFGKQVEDELCFCKVSTDSLHKPTWVDAGFTFFWYAAPADADNGQTRSLRDGKPCFKEWIAKRDSVSVEDIEFLPLTTIAAETPILDFAHLSPEYMRNCAYEVMTRRRVSCEGGYE